MTKPLTAVTVANLKPRSERFEKSDPGCAGLRLVVFPSGRKSFIVRFRYGGAQKKLTLGPALAERGVAESGTAPELGAPMSLASARELATKALREAKSGVDPCAGKQRARQEQLAAAGDTLRAISDEYLRREGPRLRTLTQRKADLDLICGGGLGQLPVAEIGRGQFTRVLDAIADTRGPVRADRVLSALRTLLNWHGGRSDYVSPLVRGGKRTSTAQRARDRVLTDDELRAVWSAAGEDKTPFGPYVRFVLLTATRRNEASGMRRCELDGDLWTIPGRRYKNGKDTVIPLSGMAREIVAAMPARGDFVFSGDGARPLGSFGERKAALDAASGVTGWTLHDLRRTARTRLSKCPGVTPDVAERCLGHAVGGIRGIYDRHEFIDEKRHAFEALAKLIERIVDPPSDDVVVQISEKARRK